MLNSKCFYILMSVLVLLSPEVTFAGPIVFSASGADAAAIQGQVDAFRVALGDPNNGNNPGPLPNGRREINWDGGNPALVATAQQNTQPFNVFLNNRGASMTTPGSGFVQAPPTGPQPGGGLAGVFNNAAYGTEFKTFSPSRLFSPIGSNITDIDFFIPGSNGGVSAFTRGFGAVFTDVDLADSTSIELFDELGNSLGKFFAPTADNGLSFIGAMFTDGTLIDRIEITSGNTPLGAADGDGTDVVAMDDFIYREPQVPEPATLGLLALGLTGLGFSRRRRA